MEVPLIQASMIDFFKTFKYGGIELGFTPTAIGRSWGGNRGIDMKKCKLPNHYSKNKKNVEFTTLISYRVGEIHLWFDSKYNALRRLSLYPSIDQRNINIQLNEVGIEHSDDWIYEQNLSDMTLYKLLKEFDMEFSHKYSIDGIFYSIQRKNPSDFQYIELEFNNKIENSDFSFSLSSISLYDGDIYNDDFYTEGPASFTTPL